jgi:wobble nucleotide-excising tRNase
MLERIENIHGVGLLHEANGKPFTFKKVTLVYADNGRGKSTLASVLRSAATRDSNLLICRQTIDSTKPQAVTLQFGNGQKTNFENNQWLGFKPNLLVFDADFVERNVHSGGTVSTGHRKNLLEFALGEQAVAAQLAAEHAAAEAHTAAAELNLISGKLSGHHNGFRLQEFQLLPLVDDIDSKLADLKRRHVSATNVASIMNRPIPSVIPELELTPFHGHLIVLTEGVRSVQTAQLKAALSCAISTTDD